MCGEYERACGCIRALVCKFTRVPCAWMCAGAQKQAPSELLMEVGLSSKPAKGHLVGTVSKWSFTCGTNPNCAHQAKAA